MSVSNDVSILLVEDEPALLGLLQRHLERIGYRVEGAPTAEAAELLLSGGAFTPALLVADETLPGQSGTELAALLLQRYPGMLCLLCSGYPLSTDLLPMPYRSRTAILQKPYLPAMLEEAIRQILPSR
ncbi:MAG TPA: response regulator [Bryobacteraceae bacterium]|nr:response regulator [Bryobacteraceae bacterium]